MVNASIAETETDETTSTEDTQVAPSKENPSLKEQAMQIILERIPNKDGKRVFPIKKRIIMWDQVWRPFDKYTLDKGWLESATRMSSSRDSPIVTPFGKKVSWDDLVSFMVSEVKQIKDPQLRAWEEREMEEYAKADYVRGEFSPIMYLGRQLLYQPRWHSLDTDLEVTLPIPKFTPLSRLNEIEIKPDAKTANVGFPVLKRLSEPGQSVAESPVYQEILERASKWAAQVHQLPKITPRIIASISPLIAVFFRAQGKGRPVQDVSAVVRFNEYKVSQPVSHASEELKEYLSGDRLEILDAIHALFNRDIDVIAKGDDSAAILKDGTIVGADATARDALVSPQQGNLYANEVASHLNGENKNLWIACCYACTEAERVNSVGMVQNPSRWGVTSGRGSTTHKNTFLTIWHTQSSERSSVQSYLKDLNKYGLYRLEFEGKESVVILKLYVNAKWPEKIHGSEVRSVGALGQREDPVLLKTTAQFRIEEEARLKAVGGNMYGHERFENFAKFVSMHWEFREPENRTTDRAVELMNKSRDTEISGKYD